MCSSDLWDQRFHPDHTEQYHQAVASDHKQLPSLAFKPPCDNESTGVLMQSINDNKGSRLAGDSDGATCKDDTCTKGPGLAGDSDHVTRKKVQFNESINDNARDCVASNRSTPHGWQQVGKLDISSVKDPELAEFVIGENVTFTFKPGTWKGFDDKTYHGNVVSTKSDKAGLKVKIVIYDDMNPNDVSSMFVYVTQPRGRKPRLTLRDILTDNYPEAKSLWDYTTHFTSDNCPLRNKIRRNKSSRVLTAVSSKLNRVSPVLNFMCVSSLSMLMCVAATNNFTLQDHHTLEPKNYWESLRRPDRAKWAEAEVHELDTLVRHGTWEIIDKPTDRVIDPLPSNWVYKLKVNQQGEIIKWKARMVMRGDMQYQSEYSDVYSPTGRIASARTLIALATQQRMYLYACDVEAAFVSADIDTEIFIDLPPGYKLPPGKVARLKKSLYGLVQASSLFYAKMKAWLVSKNFTQVGDDGTLFRQHTNKGTLLLSMYVDDLLVAASSPQLYEQFLAELKQEFSISDAGPLRQYLGVSIKYDRDAGRAVLSQEKYVKDLLEKYGMTSCKPADTPLVSGRYLTGDDCIDKNDPSNIEDIRNYQSLVGGLLWLSNCTRPDIAFATNQLARFLSCPGPSHFAAAKRVLRYLQGTQKLGIGYRRSDKDDVKANVLTCYVDSDHAGNVEDRRSISGYVFYLNGGPISWTSKRQACIAISSTEGEFYSASQAAQDTVYHRRILEELGFQQKKPTILFEDNFACIYLSKKDGSINRMKHIDTRVHRLRELTREAVIVLTKIHTGEQIADTFTKALPFASFKKHRDALMVST